MTAVKNGGAIAKTQEKASAAKRQSQKPQNIKEWITAYKSQFAKALPEAITPERFTRMALSALSQNQTLQQCTIPSFLGALMNAAQLGLEPNTPLGQAYLIPYKNHGVYEVQFQIGYKGYIDLAYRSGDVRSLQAHVVYENDEFIFEYGLEPKLIHRPAASNRGKATHVYGVFKLVNGGEGFEVMSMDDIEAHARRYSKAYSSGPWQTNFEEMAKKTVLKKLLKFAPMKSEFVKGIVSDESQQILELPSGPDEELVLRQEEYSVIDEPEVDAETGELVGSAQASSGADS